MVASVVTNACILEHSVDRNMQESCKNAPKMFKYLQLEILLGNLLGGTCIAFSAYAILDYHIYSINNSCKKCQVSSLELVKTL